jgi:tRNA nucleotidyltransferase (CCA-adding enzyme)
VQSREFLAGNTVSLFQMQILSEDELEAALQAKVGILSNNTNLRPGMDVPFMVVFPNPPETIQEYGLKVIEARRPPQ